MAVDCPGSRTKTRRGHAGIDSAPMSRVRRLASTVIDRIAAGEVVERPASVVKELVENALDAGASRIDVEVDGGGVDRILVRDDGSGMNAEDARLALERHATSKISSDEDLERRLDVRLPRRGAALDRVGLAADADDLGRLDPRGDPADDRQRRSGRTESPAARPRGTDVLVESLFAKTPARRKFLASPEAEARAVAAAVTKAALANSSVAFAAVERPRARSRRPRPWTAPADPAGLRAGDPRRARDVRGEVRAAARGRAVDAGLGDFPSRRYQYLFVNGRPIEDRALSRAIGQASRDAIRVDRHPGVFLYITAEPGSVDVNVSPAKTQVRFSDSATAFRLAYHALHSALLAGKEERRLRSRPVRRDRRGGVGAVPRPVRRASAGRFAGRRAARPALEAPPPAAPDERRPPEIVPIGQLRESYILASGRTACSSSTSTRRTSAPSTSASATGFRRGGSSRRSS